MAVATPQACFRIRGHELWLDRDLPGQPPRLIYRCVVCGMRVGYLVGYPHPVRALRKALKLTGASGWVVHGCSKG